MTDVLFLVFIHVSFAYLSTFFSSPCFLVACSGGGSHRCRSWPHCLAAALAVVRGKTWDGTPWATSVRVSALCVLCSTMTAPFEGGKSLNKAERSNWRDDVRCSGESLLIAYLHCSASLILEFSDRVTLCVFSLFRSLSQNPYVSCSRMKSISHVTMGFRFIRDKCDVTTHSTIGPFLSLIGYTYCMLDQLFLPHENDVTVKWVTLTILCLQFCSEPNALKYTEKHNNRVQ